jgi:hypothetical protein
MMGRIKCDRSMLTERMRSLVSIVYLALTDVLTTMQYCLIDQKAVEKLSLILQDVKNQHEFRDC